MTSTKGLDMRRGNHAVDRRTQSRALELLLGAPQLGGPVIGIGARRPGSGRVTAGESATHLRDRLSPLRVGCGESSTGIPVFHLSDHGPAPDMVALAHQDP